MKLPRTFFSHLRMYSMATRGKYEAQTGIPYITEEELRQVNVFFCYNHEEKRLAFQLAKKLSEHGIRVWLDEWDLSPGQRLQEALEEGIKTATAIAVLVGQGGLGSWQTAEMRGAIDESINREIPVVPVFLPGAPIRTTLPLFLRNFKSVDLRQGFTDEGLELLIRGIRNNRSSRLNEPKRRRSWGPCKSDRHIRFVHSL